jgi:hypothetical protein
MWRRIIITIALTFVVLLAVVVILVALLGDRGLVAGGGAALLLSGLLNLALADDLGGARRHLSRALNQPPRPAHPGQRVVGWLHTLGGAGLLLATVLTAILR